MRKYQQKQILELIKTLFEVNAEIKQLFSRKDYSSVVGLLAESQEFVVQVGTFIEEISGEGTQTVALLEDFHDELYQASLEVGGENPGNSFVKHLRTRLTDIENSVKTELTPDRIEVVFFPYKPSMWDSLESVWQAAEADPDCDAYVVPIPYYEKLPNGAFGQMHYEADLYPDYVPVVDWREYDVEERHPDVVYIHYAYDDMTQNYSVHPNFFAKNMKPYCELLVYIPYYVQSVAKVPEYNGCLPGIVNSDFVIVQSEEVRQGYIEQYSKYYNKNKHLEQLKKPEDKFIALGSPKFDKLINSKREDFQLPEEWRRLIYKSDGTAKKIVLYNTHMFRWLDGGEQYFKKVRSVFEMFRERDDVVLWWRPHPSTEQNFRTLRPQMLDEYYRTVEEYKSGSFGIYDDTPELHRAITWTDAYYGDGSSVAQLYSAAGKPVLYQSSLVDNTLEATMPPLLPYDFKVLGNTVWFSIASISGLFSLDLNNNMLKYHGSASGKMRMSRWHHGKLFTDNDSVWLTPAKDDTILIYAKQTGELRSFLVEGAKDFGYFEAFMVDNKLALLPYYANEIIIVDTVTEKITRNKKICSELDKMFGKPNRAKEEFYFSSSAVINESEVLLPCGIGNAVVRYNIKTDEHQIIRVGSSENKYISILCEDDNCWLISSQQIVKWNRKDNTITEISEYPDDFATGKKYSFSTAVIFEDKLFVFPNQANAILTIDINTNGVKKFENIDERNESRFFVQDSSKYYSANLIGDFIFVVSYYEYALQKINSRTGEIENIHIELSDEMYADLRLFDSAEPYIYEKHVSLNTFLDKLINEDEISLINNAVSAVNFDGTCGKKIHERFAAHVLER